MKLRILYCSEEIQDIQRKESQTITGAPNLFVYGNDVDSVDIAVRVAMVSITNILWKMYTNVRMSRIKFKKYKFFKFLFFRYDFLIVVIC